MAKGKPRHNPNKKANRMNPYCPCFESIGGKEYCSAYDPKKLKCDGNVHNCVKVKYHKLAAIK